MTLCHVQKGELLCSRTHSAHGVSVASSPNYAVRSSWNNMKSINTQEAVTSREANTSVSNRASHPRPKSNYKCTPPIQRSQNSSEAATGGVPRPSTSGVRNSCRNHGYTCIRIDSTQRMAFVSSTQKNVLQLRDKPASRNKREGAGEQALAIFAGLLTLGLRSEIFRDGHADFLAVVAVLVHMRCNSSRKRP